MKQGVYMEQATSFPTEYAICLAWADEFCSGMVTHRAHYEMEPCSIPYPLVWDKTPNGDEEWIFALNRHSILENLARAWALTKNELYRKTFIDRILAWIEACPHTQESERTTWRSLEAGIRISSWLNSLSLFSSSLPETVVKAMETSLDEHANYLLETHRPFHRLSNWGIIQDHGLLLYAVHRQDRQLYALASNRLEDELSLQVMNDGSHWEQSPLYQCQVLQCAVSLVRSSRDAGFAVSPLLSQKAHALAVSLGKWTRADGILPPYGDSDEIDCRDLLIDAALLFNDAELSHRGGGKLLWENSWHWDESAQEHLDHLCASSPFSRKSTALFDSGNYFLHAGQVSIHFHTGCLGSGHGHLDQGSINLTIQNQPVLCDGGRYTYQDLPIRRELKNPKAHSVCLLHDHEYAQSLGSWSYTGFANPIKGEYVFSDDLDCVEGYHLGYLSENVVQRRRLVRLASSFMVVFDEFIGLKDPTFAANYWHFPPKGLVSKEAENRCLWKNEDTVVSLCCISSFQSELLTGKTSPVYNILNDHPVWKTRTELPTAGAIITVIGWNESADFTCKAETVSLMESKEVLDSSYASAVSITAKEGTWTILSRIQEIIHQVDIVQAGAAQGYGRLLVQYPQEPRTRTVLW